MTKTCPSCMSPVPITAKVCPHCRGDVSDPVDTLGADAVRGVTDLFNSESGNRSSAHQGSGKPLRGVGLIVFLVGTAVAFTFFLSLVGADQGWWKGNLLDWLGLSP
ncbi:MAG: zinc ribbon domain-containing protein [Polyangiaceae bacterium]|nr:zinc ribbon domain-containing protein [Polyangiaceae bacterium]